MFSNTFIVLGKQIYYCLTTVWNFPGGEQSSALVHLVTLPCTPEICLCLLLGFWPQMAATCASNSPQIALKFQMEPYYFRIQFKLLRDLSGIVLFVWSSFSLSLSPSEWWCLVQIFSSFVRCWRSNGIQVRGQAGEEEIGNKWEHLMENKYY